MSHQNIQLPDSLYQRLQQLSEQEGLAVDQFVAMAVTEKIAALTADRYLQERARNKYEDMLAKVPNIEPVPYDRLPSA